MEQFLVFIMAKGDFNHQSNKLYNLNVFLGLVLGKTIIDKAIAYHINYNQTAKEKYK